VRSALPAHIGEIHWRAGFVLWLLKILYLRFRLWLLWKSVNVRNAIGGYLLRCSARLAPLGASLMRDE
jgi:hypothetical protein